MDKNASVLVCISIMVLDIVAGILGIEAEIAQNKVNHLKMWIFECRDPSYKAFQLGLAASMLLCLAHTIASLFGGCICIRSKEELDQSSSNRQLAFASLVLSWVTLVVAFSMLISGTLDNSSSRKDCGVSHNRLLSIGGILCFIHGLFAVSYSISANATIQDEKKLNQQAPQGSQA